MRSLVPPVAEEGVAENALPRTDSGAQCSCLGHSFNQWERIPSEVAQGVKWVAELHRGPGEGEGRRPLPQRTARQHARFLLFGVTYRSPRCYCCFIRPAAFKLLSLAVVSPLTGGHFISP